MKYGDYTDEACRNPEAKRDTRERPLDIIREHSCNLWSRSRNALRYDWLELAGHHAPTLTLLRDQGALDAGARFIGVDHDRTAIDGCIEHHAGTPAVWIHGTLNNVLETDAHADTVRRVGVLVYDSHDGINRNHIERTLRPLFDFARRQRDAIGEFLLVLNLVADPLYTRSNHIDRYIAALSKGLGASVSPDDIHPYRSNTTLMHWVALRYGF